MEDIDKRLRETTDACIKSFDSWLKQNKNLESRETLMETMHEVRKVISRVEIEIAISERDRLGSRPLPIPPHRSSRKAAGEDNSDDHDNDVMDMADNQPRQGGENRRPQHHRQRRPIHNRGGSGGGGGNDSNGNGNSESQPS